MCPPGFYNYMTSSYSELHLLSTVVFTLALSNLFPAAYTVIVLSPALYHPNVPLRIVLISVAVDS